ncbi:MAG: TRAP transporter substrate-binding protein [Deltaproteobacteria bacterium]|nr:TRAP transporter substrate-binding protein [Deltaproteobacteria bacterium]
MRQFTKTSLPALMLAIALSVQAPLARADEPATLRIGSVAPTGTPWSALLASVKSRVLAEAPGRIDVKLYLGGKLGSEGSLVSRCQKGSLGGIAVSVGALGAAVPELFAMELPYLFDSYKQADKALDASTPLVRKLLDAKGFVFYMWGENGFREFASKEKFFVTPADLAGQKMRSQPAMPHVEMYRALGASASTIAVGEVGSSLASGVVNGYDNTLLYAYATQWHKEIKYVTISDHIYQGAIVVWCKAWFDTLPEDLKTVLMKVPDGETTRGRLAVRAMNELLLNEYKKDGIQIRKLTAAEKAAFARATASVAKRFLEETTPAGKELYHLLEKSR